MVAMAEFDLSDDPSQESFGVGDDDGEGGGVDGALAGDADGGTIRRSNSTSFSSILNADVLVYEISLI